MVLKCPVCGSPDRDHIPPRYQGPCITSQMFFLDHVVLDNCCCRSCGLIYNAQGVRGIEEEVYNPEVWKPKPQVLSFDGEVKSVHQRTLEVFQKLAKLPPRGRMLDFGAGNGSFLRLCSAALRGWEFSAIEPGKGGSSLQDIANLNQIFHGPYYDWRPEEPFNAIVVMSVLEHVADPLDALRWMRKRLAQGGILLMQHPNFERMPGDIFCADHINKLTPLYLKELCRHAGFRLVAEDPSGVVFHQAFALDSTDSGAVPRCYESSAQVARQAARTAQAIIASVETAVAEAGRRGGAAAVFGTSPIGTMAPLVLGCQEQVACLVDENVNNWGRVVGRWTVVGPERMAELGVSDLALAISPAYWEQVAAKMEPYDVTVHVPQV